MKLNFSVLPGQYGIYRLAESAPIPTPTTQGLWSFSRSDGEATVVCREGGCPHAHKKEEGWAALKLHGPFDFALTGIVAEVSRVLASAGVGVFVISTFDTDYVLVKVINLARSLDALSRAGHVIF